MQINILPDIVAPKQRFIKNNIQNIIQLRSIFHAITRQFNKQHFGNHHANFPDRYNNNNFIKASGNHQIKIIVFLISTYRIIKHTPDREHK